MRRLPTGTISFESLHRFVEDALGRCGLSARDAYVVADVLATTDAWGVYTHGVSNLPGYMARLDAGGICAGATPRIEGQGLAWAVLDGESGMGQVVSVAAMEHAIEKARCAGIGFVAVRNSGHFGAAGYYAWNAAREGLIGICMANDVPTVAAPGSREAVLGSNPIAYALPAGRHRPVVLDISTAAAAGGKIYAAQGRGDSIPDTWLLDGEGNATTDPSRFPQEGALQPAAGHKGYGLGLLIEVLAAAVSGAAMTSDVGSWMWGDPTLPTGHGAAFLAIDVASLSGGRAFERRVEELVDELRSAPVAEGRESIKVPGEAEWENYDRARSQGIDLPQSVVAKLCEAADLVGLEIDWTGR